jgi:hypothetical protein
MTAAQPPEPEADPADTDRSAADSAQTLWAKVAEQ